MVLLKKRTESTLGLLSGLILLSFPIFFEEKFSNHWAFSITYMILICIGVCLCIYYFSSLIKIKPVYAFLLIVFFEIGIYSSFFLIKINYIKSEQVRKYHRNYYQGYLRSIPSFQKGLGRFDPDLFYTLQPGEAINSNIEFSNKYTVNSQGLRDDNFSLENPEVIFLGDSNTMGWGVDQEETYVEIFENKSKLRTLNAGIVSYGSAREYLLFRKLNTDSCKTIVWQYCPNDKHENKSFLKKNNSLNISSKQEYQKSVNRNFIQASYYPFKFIFEAMAHQFRRSKHRRRFLREPIEVSEEVANYFHIIELLQQGFDGQIVIFNMQSYHLSNDIYLEFKNHLANKQLENIKVIDFSSILLEEDFYIIDGHINSSGHKKIGESLYQILVND